MNTAFSNANLKDKVGEVYTAGFTPKVTFDYDPAAKTVDLDDESTYPSGDYRKAAIITITDVKGKKVTGAIGTDNANQSLADAVSISVATLDLSGGLYVQACVVSNNRLVGDGHANEVAVAALEGELGSWALSSSPL